MPTAETDVGGVQAQGETRGGEGFAFLGGVCPYPGTMVTCAHVPHALSLLLISAMCCHSELATGAPACLHHSELANASFELYGCGAQLFRRLSRSSDAAVECPGRLCFFVCPWRSRPVGRLFSRRASCSDARARCSWSACMPTSSLLLLLLALAFSVLSSSSFFFVLQVRFFVAISRMLAHIEFFKCRFIQDPVEAVKEIARKA